MKLDINYLMEVPLGSISLLWVIEEVLEGDWSSVMVVVRVKKTLG